MANLVYAKPATTVVFKQSGGDIAFNLDSISTAAGRISALWDRGTGAQPADYEVQLVVKGNAAGTVGLSATLFYASSSDSTTYDANLTAGDAALSGAPAGVEARRNCRALVSIQCDVVTNPATFVNTQTVRITSRYVVLVFYNELGITTNASANTSFVRITPVPVEIQ